LAKHPNIQTSNHPRRQGSRVRGQKSEDRRQRSRVFNSKLNTQNSKLHSRGFTLIELIIFIIIAGIFLPATFVAFSSAMKQGTQPEDYTRGMLLTEQTMELGIKRGYTQLVSDVAAPPTCATVIGVSIPAGYSCTFTPSFITSLGGLSLSSNNYVQIAVSVTTPQGNTFSSTGMVTNHGF